MGSLWYNTQKGDMLIELCFDTRQHRFPIFFWHHDLLDTFFYSITTFHHTYYSKIIQIMYLWWQECTLTNYIKCGKKCSELTTKSWKGRNYIYIFWSICVWDFYMYIKWVPENKINCKKLLKRFHIIYGSLEGGKN